jgi:UDP-GlcNAc:undecaprenyl-phosphate GlcNAc-1-phosphate transferase
MNCDQMTHAMRLEAVTSLLLHSLPALVASFLVALVAVPVARSVAHKTGVVDKPDRVRKLHGRTVAYLGGVGVFVGVFAGIIVSAVITGGDVAALPPVPFSVILGMIAITFTGLADDIWKFDARLKVAGQLVGAAALAIDEIGVNVATGLLSPVFGAPQEPLLTVAGLTVVNASLFYWVGTALVAAFVLGGSNAANLLDGLDGLLSGITAVMCVGLLAVSLAIVYAFPPDLSNIGDLSRSMAGTRVVLCLSLLGACLGFLVYNFNPASIFLGDAGSLLLGYLSVTIIMTFANLQPFDCAWAAKAPIESVVPGTGQLAPPAALERDTFAAASVVLVACGLAMFGLPILDTTLAIIRRRRAGVPFSTPDANHLHHRVKRSFDGSVRKTVVALYGMEAGLVLLGCTAAYFTIFGHVRMLWPFLSLIIAFIVLVLLGMRGTGAAPTVVRNRPAGAAGDAAPRDPSAP